MKMLVVVALSLVPAYTVSAAPELSPDALARQCVAVVVVEAAKGTNGTDFHIVETWYGNVHEGQLPPTAAAGLAGLEPGSRAVAFLELKSLSSRPSTVSGIQLRVAKVARIQGDHVLYPGPKPGGASGGEVITELTLKELREVIAKATGNVPVRIAPKLDGPRR